MARGLRIDKAQFEMLCAIFCTHDEILSFFGVCDETLRNWCKQEYGCDAKTAEANFRKRGNVSLRRIQFKQAEKNPSMAMFLGKNYLGQSDRPREEAQDERIEIAHDVPEGEG